VAAKSKDKDNKEFYIVDKRILPKSIQNVIKVNDLILKTKMSKYSAIKKVGISRSTYYKYKDFIKPFYEGGEDKVYSLHLSLKDRVGILSDVLDVIAKEKISILTVVQNMAVDGIFWQLLAYCAGVGGSMLIIGSAAGVVVMGLEKITFGWYMKKITWIAFVGYIAGILSYYLIRSFIFKTPL